MARHTFGTAIPHCIDAPAAQQAHNINSIACSIQALRTEVLCDRTFELVRLQQQCHMSCPPPCVHGSTRNDNLQSSVIVPHELNDMSSSCMIQAFVPERHPAHQRCSVPLFLEYARISRRRLRRGTLHFHQTNAQGAF